MADLPTRAELVARCRDALLAVPNANLSASEVDRDGSDLNLLVAASALLGETIVTRLALAISGLFERTAEDDDLDKLIFDRKGLPREGAVPAVNILTLERLTADEGAGVIDGGPANSLPAPTRIRSNRGIVYEFREPVTWAADALGPLTVLAEAALAGSEFVVGDADAGWTFIDVPFDESITIRTEARTAGGADEERDTEYRARARGYFPALRRGTLPAIRYGALSAPGVRGATVVEPLNPDGLPNGTVDVYALDPAGQTNEALAARTQLALLEYRAGGVPATVRNAQVERVTIQFTSVGWDAAIVRDTREAKRLLQVRVAAALENQQPGESLYRRTILAAASTVPGLILEDTDLIEPSATVVPAANIALRTLPELVELV